MKRRRRVLHLITSFPLSSGAAENTKLTLNLLNRNRFEPFLGTAPGQAMETEVAPDVARLPLPRLTRSVRPVADALAFAQLCGVMRQVQFDIVHTHNAKDGILGRWAAYLAGVPHIVHTIHNVSFQASGSSVVNRFYALNERWAARITQRILAVSDDSTVRYLQAKVGRAEQYRTVYSGLQLARYDDDGRAAAERRIGLGLPDRSGPWVGWFGRFNAQKDPLTFVRAARLVADAIPSVQFVLCGDDPLDDSLEPAAQALSRRLGLGDQMHFCGLVRPISTVLRAVDLVMHSSRYEGMGRVVCEALACERAVVGTAVGGVVEAIVSGQRGGLLVPPGDPVALAGSACRLLRDREWASELGRAGRAWVETHLSAERMVEAIEFAYEELLAS